MRGKNRKENNIIPSKGGNAFPSKAYTQIITI